MVVHQVTLITLQQTRSQFWKIRMGRTRKSSKAKMRTRSKTTNKPMSTSQRSTTLASIWTKTKEVSCLMFVDRSVTDVCVEMTEEEKIYEMYS